MKKIFGILIMLGAFLCSNITAQANNEMGEYGRLYMYDINDEEIPVDVQMAANLYGSEYNICPELLEAIAYTESRYDPTVSNCKCVGLMQIHIPSHRDRMTKLNITENEMYQIYANMRVAADYLSELFEEYEDPAIVLAIYHGEKNYSVTNMSKYVRNILELSEELERKHGK